MIKVATVDNHEVVNDGIIGRIARSAPDLTVVAATSTVEELLDSGVEVDVVLLDLLLADGEATPWVPVLLERGMQVLLHTTEEAPVPLRRAARAGICGLVLKRDPAQSVVDAIRAVEKGEFYCSGPFAHALLTDETVVVGLSPRQVDILRAIEEGLDYSAAGRTLGLSESSVKTHLGRIRDKYRKIGIEPGNTHHLIRLARQQGHLT